MWLGVQWWAYEYVDGGIIADLAYSGAPLPGGEGNAPNITTDAESGIGTWSVGDIVGMMKTGFLPDFDVVGGDMTDVQQNLARLTADDQTAMAEYLKTLPAIPSSYKATQAGGDDFKALSKLIK